MDATHFSTTLVVDQTSDAVFAAINNVGSWWEGDIEGSALQVGDEFTYRYQDLHYSKQRVTELVPGRRIVWRVVEANLTFLADPAEWVGTEITFDIEPVGDGTEIRFSHVGLLPSFECFEMCSSAWRSIISDGLGSLVLKG